MPLDSPVVRFYSGFLAMDKPQNTAASPTDPRNHGPQGSAYCEPALLRYLHMIWTYRWLMLGGSLLPALVVALVLALGPRKYTATFVYERPLAESEYSVLLRRFYSQENLDKIVGQLRERGLTEYIQHLDRARMSQSFEQLIRFEVAPMYPKRLQTTDPCTSERISAFKARLLSVKVLGDSQEEVAGASAVVTGNIESILPIYDIRNHLKESLQKLRESAAKIEDDRFKLSLDLQKEKAKLEKLKALQDTPGEPPAGSIILQFNVETGPSLYQVRAGATRTGNLQEMLGSGAEKYTFHEFLPLAYQIRAVQSKIVDLQETVTNDAEKYNFCLQVLEIDGRLLAKIEESLLTYYTAQQYLGFLGEQLLACKEPSVGDHLKSYIRKTENLVLVNTRAGENPVVYPMSKGVGKNAALTFVLFLMIGMFASVLLEHRHERRHGQRMDWGPGSNSHATPLGIAAPDRHPG
jgi:hypothetical protein